MTLVILINSANIQKWLTGHKYSWQFVLHVVLKVAKPSQDLWSVQSRLECQNSLLFEEFWPNYLFNYWPEKTFQNLYFRTFTSIKKLNQYYDFQQSIFQTYIDTFANCK